jgi:hypothetical protein
MIVLEGWKINFSLLELAVWQGITCVGKGGCSCFLFLGLFCCSELIHSLVHISGAHPILTLWPQKMKAVYFDGKCGKIVSNFEAIMTF